MKSKVYRFFDFDGTLIDSPMPDEGKIIWKDKKGFDYPYLGWWGRPESLDLSVFDIKANDKVKYELLKSFENNDRTYILTSRLKKLKESVFNVLKHNDIDITKFTGFSFFTDQDKGQRILNIIEDEKNEIKEIHVYEDRDKEFVVLNAIRPILESLGIDYYVHEVKIK